MPGEVEVKPKDSSSKKSPTPAKPKVTPTPRDHSDQKTPTRPTEPRPKSQNLGAAKNATLTATTEPDETTPATKPKAGPAPVAAKASPAAVAANASPGPAQPEAKATPAEPEAKATPAEPAQAPAPAAPEEIPQAEKSGGSRVSSLLPPSLRSLAMPLVTGLITGLVAATLIVGYALTRPNEYTARIALSGVPAAVATTDAKGTVPDFSAVITANMASVAEYVRAPSVLEDVTRTVPNSPPATDVDQSIAVELVPLSSLARISVSAPTEKTAAALADALAKKVIAADLIGPSAKFRLLEKGPAPTLQTAPDTKLGLGLGLVGGALLGVAGAATHLLLRPRVVSRRQVARLLDDPTMAVLEIDSDNSLLPLRAFVRAIDGVQVLPVGPGAALGVSALREQLGEENVRAFRSAPILLVARRGKTRPADITSAIALNERGGMRVLGVALL